MKNLALKRIQRMKPYQPPLKGRSEYDGLLLDFNERTQQPNRKVSQALEKFVKGKKLQVYPEYFDLEEKIAKYAGVSPEQVMFTNGSGQGIDIIFRTFTEKGDKVIIPSPTFAMFEQCAQVIGNEILSPLYKKSGLSFPLKEVIEAIDEQVRLMVLCNPNNPTGTTVSVADIERIAQNAPNVILYIDEAYFEFSKITASPLIKKYPNIIITRTFSKAFGLASLRIGYVIARKEYITEMLKVRGPYDVNMAAYYAASAALEDRQSMQCYVAEVMKKAKPLVEKFFSENGIPYFPSSANFILFRQGDPENTIRALTKAGVLVRPQNKENKFLFLNFPNQVFVPKFPKFRNKESEIKNIEDTLRVSIGTVAQMKKFIETYKKAVLKNKCRH